MIDFQDFTTQSILAVTSRRSGTVQNRPIPALDDRYLMVCGVCLVAAHCFNDRRFVKCGRDFESGQGNTHRCAHNAAS